MWHDARTDLPGGAGQTLSGPPLKAQLQHWARIRGRGVGGGLLTCPRERGTHQPPLCPSSVPRGQLSPLLWASTSCREKMVQDTGLMYQQFKNCRDNLSSWLEQLPRGQVRPSDGPSQIAYKLQAQKVRSWSCR